MADDITLTVRVRDLSHGELTRLQGQMNRLRTTTNNMTRSTNDQRRTAHQLSSELDSLSNRMRDVMRSGSLSRSELDRMNNSLSIVSRGMRTAQRQGALTGDQFRRMTRDAALLRARLQLLGGDGNVFGRMASRLLLFQNRLRTTTTHAGALRRAFRAMGDWGLTGMIRATRGTSLLWAGMRRLGSAINVNQRWTAILLATILLLGPAAQVLGALLVTALGGAFVALGAFALKGNKQVKSAFADMKSTVGSVFRDAAQPLAGPLTQAMKILSQAAVQLKPLLTEAFTAAGPIATSFANAISNLAKSSMPGMVAALQNSEGAMKGFEEAMSRIGTGFGDMFKIMTQGNDEELARAWVTLGNEIGNVLESIGEFISTSVKSGTATLALIGIFRIFTGALNLVAGALDAVDSIFGSMFTHLADHISGFSGVDSALSDSFKFSAQSAQELQKELDKTNTAIDKINSNGKGLSGSALKLYRGDTDYDKLVTKRAALEAAIKAKTDESTKANKANAQSLQDIIDKIRELNELNRASLDARAAQEQAIDDANKGYKKYSDALSMTNGQLNLNKQSSRDAYEFLSKIAGATNDAVKAAQDSKAPWSEVNAEWKRGYDNVVRLGVGMGLSKTQARDLANEIIKMPDPKISLKAETKQAKSDLEAFNAAVKRTPNAHSVTVKTLSSTAEKVLEAFGYKVTHLKNGKTKITAAAGSALATIAHVAAVLANLDGTVARTRIETTNATIYTNSGKSLHDTVGATGGLFTGRSFKRGMADGGAVVGPGNGTSDDVYAPWLSNGEFVMKTAAVQKYGLNFMNLLNSGRLKLNGYASGGKVSTATKNARNELAGQFSISRYGAMAGTKNDSFERGLGLPQSLSALASALNDARKNIRAATSGSTEKRLLKALDSAGKGLIKYEKQLTKVNASLEKAKTKLDDLKSAASQMNDSIRSNVMSATDITRNSTSGGTLTVSNLMATMTEGRDKSTAFAQALKDLKAKGVDKEIIKNIANAGIEGGGLETAGTLLTASSSEISSINDLQKQIGTAAKSAGKTASDSMYAAGIQAAEGVVKGLEKKQKSIENAMMKIAKSMEKAIKKALGIKSPSKVMEKVGDFTAQGFAVGMEKNRDTDKAWASMLTTTPGTTGGGGSVARGGDQFVMPIYIGNKLMDEIWLDSGRRVVRTRGGNVQATLGRKTS